MRRRRPTRTSVRAGGELGSGLRHHLLHLNGIRMPRGQECDVKLNQAPLTRFRTTRERPGSSQPNASQSQRSGSMRHNDHCSRRRRPRRAHKAALGLVGQRPDRAQIDRKSPPERRSATISPENRPQRPRIDDRASTPTRPHIDPGSTPRRPVNAPGSIRSRPKIRRTSTLDAQGVRREGGGARRRREAATNAGGNGDRRPRGAELDDRWNKRHNAVLLCSLLPHSRSFVEPQRRRLTCKGEGAMGCSALRVRPRRR